MNSLASQIQEALPQESPSFIPPVEGTVLSDFNDSRAGGRQHQSGDLSAKPGTPVVAPRDMRYLYGGRGGTNLRDNDHWAHFQDVETGKEYRFAHIGGVPDLQPGQVVKQGEPWSTVGNVVDHPHLHMSVYDPKSGGNEDWLAANGLSKGQSTKQIQIVRQTQSREGESIPFDRGGKSYMDPSMLAKGGFGLPGMDTDLSGIQAGIDAGANTQPGFLQQVLGALGGGGGGGKGGGGGGGGLIGDAINSVGSIASPFIDLAMLLKTDKMARQHAGELQRIAANPPMPGWARSIKGPGMNS